MVDDFVSCTAFLVGSTHQTRSGYVMWACPTIIRKGLAKWASHRRLPGAVEIVEAPWRPQVSQVSPVFRFDRSERCCGDRRPGLSGSTDAHKRGTCERKDESIINYT